MANDHDRFEYDVALSFAGEDRTTAEQFAGLLKAKGIKIFYDEYDAANLWGKNLVDHLADIYGKRARYCLMFISQYYPLKKWTNLERTHAQARAFRDPNEYILPIRLDDTEVPGMTETIGYIDLRKRSIKAAVDLLEQKLSKTKGQTTVSIQSDQPGNVQSNGSPFGSIPMPKRKKAFTQLEKDRFAKDSYNFIKQYFQRALHELESQDSDLQTDFVEVTTLQFTSKIYLRGDVKAQCMIWLGSDIIANTVYYREGTHRLNDGGINDYLPVVDNEEELRLQIGNFGLGITHVEDPLATQPQAAEYLWRRFTSHLEY